MSDRASPPKHFDIVRANLPLLRWLNECDGNREMCEVDELALIRPPVQSVRFDIDSIGLEGEISEYNLDYLSRVCWACGMKCNGRLTKCHVMSHWVGGSNTPDNYYLLCDYCHNDQPDESSREVQEEWLANREYAWDRIWRESKEIMEALKQVPGNSQLMMYLFHHKMLRVRKCKAPYESQNLLHGLLEKAQSFKLEKFQKRRIELLVSIYIKFIRSVKRYSRYVKGRGGGLLKKYGVLIFG